MIFSLPLNKKIRRILSISAIAACLVSFTLTLLLEVKSTKDDLAQDMKNAAKTCIELTSDYIDRYHDLITALIAALPSDHELTIINYFKKNLPLLGPGDHYYILNSQGRMIYTSGNYEEFINFDFSHLEYIQANENISEIHQSIFHNQPVITLAFKLPGKNMLLLEKSISNLIPLLHHINITGTQGQALMFILSANGTVVYHPDHELMTSRHNLGFELKNQSTPNHRGLRTYTYKNQKYISYTQSFTKPLGWQFYASLPYQAIIPRIIRHTGRQFLLITGILIFLILIIRQKINTSLSKPLSQISNFISEIKPLADSGLMPEEMAAGTLELSQVITAANNLIVKIRETNATLIKIDELLLGIMDNTSNIIYQKDARGRYLLINKRFEETFNITQAEISNLTDYDIFPENIADVFTRNERKVLATGIPMQFEETAFQGDGLHTYTSIKFPIYDQDGIPYRICCISTDITKRQQLDDQLR
ncbi:MAG: PAS domain-containing protein [Proteobacteria bacterium]|nr:PAS domain-containing protein [Pseudomonadota bacterium]MBU1716305.1 PAS domain-containing protein [Pseudomonadota bacterium]